MISPSDIQNAILRSPEDGTATIKAFKSAIKRAPVSLPLVSAYFEALTVPFNTKHEYALHAVAFAAICHLTHRVITQDSSVLNERATTVLPVLIQHLASDRFDGETAVRTLEDFWLACPEPTETAVREIALVHDRPDIREAALRLLANHIALVGGNFRFRLFTEPVTRLVMDEIASVRTAAFSVLVGYFRDASDRARYEFRQELRRQEVPSVIFEKLLGKLPKIPTTSNLADEDASVRTSDDSSADSRAHPSSRGSGALPVHGIKASTPESRQTSADTALEAGQGRSRLQEFVSSFSSVLPQSSRSSKVSPSACAKSASYSGAKKLPPTISRPAAAASATSLTSRILSNSFYAPQNIEPSNVVSIDTFRKEIDSMLTEFDGKETENNWLQRQEAIKRLRGLLRGNMYDFPGDFVAALRKLAHGIAACILSLRTTLATTSIHLVKESAQILGDYLDPVLEPFLTSLVKVASGSKKITANLSHISVCALVLNTSYSPKYVNHISQAFREKSSSARNNAIQWLHLLLVKHEMPLRPVLEASGADKIIENIILRGVSDADPAVRESSRRVYWLFSMMWPPRGEAMAKSMSLVVRKNVLKSQPTELFEKVDSQVSRTKPVEERVRVVTEGGANAKAEGTQFVPGSKIPEVYRRISQVLMHDNGPYDNVQIDTSASAQFQAKDGTEPRCQLVDSPRPEPTSRHSGTDSELSPTAVLTAKAKSRNADSAIVRQTLADDIGEHSPDNNDDGIRPGAKLIHKRDDEVQGGLASNDLDSDDNKYQGETVVDNADVKEIVGYNQENSGNETPVSIEETAEIKKSVEEAAETVEREAREGQSGGAKPETRESTQDQDSAQSSQVVGLDTKTQDTVKNPAGPAEHPELGANNDHAKDTNDSDSESGGALDEAVKRVTKDYKDESKAVSTANHRLTSLSELLSSEDVGTVKSGVQIVSFLLRGEKPPSELTHGLGSVSLPGNPDIVGQALTFLFDKATDQMPEVHDLLVQYVSPDLVSTALNYAGHAVIVYLAIHLLPAEVLFVTFQVIEPLIDVASLIDAIFEIVTADDISDAAMMSIGQLLLRFDKVPMTPALRTKAKAALEVIYRFGDLAQDVMAFLSDWIGFDSSSEGSSDSDDESDEESLAKKHQLKLERVAVKVPTAVAQAVSTAAMIHAGDIDPLPSDDVDRGLPEQGESMSVGSNRVESTADQQAPADPGRRVPEGCQNNGSTQAGLFSEAVNLVHPISISYKPVRGTTKSVRTLRPNSTLSSFSKESSEKFSFENMLLVAEELRIDFPQDEGDIMETLTSRVTALENRSIDRDGLLQLATIVKESALLEQMNSVLKGNIPPVLQRASDSKINTAWNDRPDIEARTQNAVLHFISDSPELDELTLALGLLLTYELIKKDAFVNDTEHIKVLNALINVSSRELSEKTAIIGLPKARDALLSVSSLNRPALMRAITCTFDDSLNRRAQIFILRTIRRLLIHGTPVTPDLTDVIKQAITHSDLFVRKEAYPVLLAIHRQSEEASIAVEAQMSHGQRQLFGYYLDAETS